MAPLNFICIQSFILACLAGHVTRSESCDLTRKRLAEAAVLPSVSGEGDDVSGCLIFPEKRHRETELLLHLCPPGHARLPAGLSCPATPACPGEGGSSHRTPRQQPFPMPEASSDTKTELSGQQTSSYLPGEAMVPGCQS
ncbi:hypothetical protein GDO81_016705 [Engystomops pustulosus]|uniref:Uncharacterized protein n=1 Tax=Engystomops pustulosus TaxID=76066 RepID=A0AAV7AHZ8_ENGPU|nr:hypothetical protein GDO81_016705 [Engystomops pustulosus]